MYVSWEPDMAAVALSRSATIFNSEFGVNPPHVDGCGVFCRAQQHVGGAVPQSHHLVGVGLGGHRLGSGQTWREAPVSLSLTTH